MLIRVQVGQENSSGVARDPVHIMSVVMTQLPKCAFTKVQQQGIVRTYVDKCAGDISYLHWDGRLCSQEDDFWILTFFSLLVLGRATLYNLPVFQHLLLETGELQDLSYEFIRVANNKGIPLLLPLGTELIPEEAFTVDYGHNEGSAFFLTVEIGEWERELPEAQL